MTNARLRKNERIVAECTPMVRVIARGIARRTPPNICFDDLAQVGYLGLLDAIGKYDASRSVPFKSYAQYRVRGQMLDWLSLKQHTRTDSIHTDERGREAVADLSDEAARRPDALACLDQARATVRRALQTLPERLRLVIRMRYWDERKMREIGAELGVGESRAIQMHTKAIQLLRDSLSDSPVEMAA